jgi:hypothetical protein
MIPSILVIEDNPLNLELERERLGLGAEPGLHSADDAG